MALENYAFTSGSWDLAALTDVQSVSINENSVPTDLSANASRTVGLVIVDNKSVDITVTVLDNNLSSNAKFRNGHAGQLVLNGKLRTAGDGLSTAITVTIPKAVLIDSTNDMNHQGESNFTMQFRAYNDEVDHSDADSGLIVYS